MARYLTLSPTIAPELQEKLRAMMEQVDAAASRADAAAAAAEPGPASTWLHSIIGDDSTVSALRSTAKAAHALAEAVAGKCGRLQGNAEALAELREAIAGRWAENLGDIEAIGQRLSAAAMVSTVAADTAADVGRGVAAVGEAALDTGKAALSAVKWVPFVALAVGALLLFTWGKRKVVPA